MTSPGVDKQTWRVRASLRVGLCFCVVMLLATTAPPAHGGPIGPSGGPGEIAAWMIPAALVLEPPQKGLLAKIRKKVTAAKAATGRKLTAAKMAVGRKCTTFKAAVRRVFTRTRVPSNGLTTLHVSNIFSSPTRGGAVPQAPTRSAVAEGSRFANMTRVPSSRSVHEVAASSSSGRESGLQRTESARSSSGEGQYGQIPSWRDIGYAHMPTAPGGTGTFEQLPLSRTSSFSSARGSSSWSLAGTGTRTSWGESTGTIRLGSTIGLGGTVTLGDTIPLQSRRPTADSLTASASASSSRDSLPPLRSRLSNKYDSIPQELQRLSASSVSHPYGVLPFIPKSEMQYMSRYGKAPSAPAPSSK